MGSKIFIMCLTYEFIVGILRQHFKRLSLSVAFFFFFFWYNFYAKLFFLNIY